jgi:hypothetical protein
VNQVTRYYVSSEITQNKCKVNWSVSGGQITGSSTGYEVFVTWEYGGACSISLDTWGCTNPVLCCAEVSIYPQNPPPPPPVVISGYVKNNCGLGIPDVTINFNGINVSAITSSSGFYSVVIPYGSSGTVTASKAGYNFRLLKAILTALQVKHSIFLSLVQQVLCLLLAGTV